MPRYNIVKLENGRFNKIVQNVQEVELIQLETETSRLQKIVDDLQREKDRIEKALGDELDRINAQLKEATSELEDSKSYLTGGDELVVQPAAGMVESTETGPEDGPSSVVENQNAEPVAAF